MSKLQITVLIVLWVFALIPPALNSLLPIRFKVAALASLIGFFPGLGGGAAFAGVWVGFIQIFGGSGEMSYLDIAKSHWDQMLLIVISGPAVAMIGVACMFVYYSKDIPSPEE